jgi:adenosine kinase
MAASSPLIIGVCNPLLDISADVPLSVFEKYGLAPGTACLAEPKHIPLYNELIQNYEVKYIAGGAGQNSMRACQWMMQTPGAVGYIGSIGKDANGVVLKKAVEGDGVVDYYHVDDEAPTGTCACLIHEKERCLVANLAAANNYKIAHLLSAPVQAALDNAKMYYVTGFFLTVCPDAIYHIGQKAVDQNKHFLFNISAPFIVGLGDIFQRVLPYVDVLFGNETEAEAFGKQNGWEETDLDAIAIKAQSLPKASTRPRIVIFTQGAKQTIVCEGGQVRHFPVPCIDPALIVDTNGAGDSFVGGFLSRFVRGESLEECVRAGHYCASKVIQVSGAVYLGKPEI